MRSATNLLTTVLVSTLLLSACVGGNTQAPGKSKRPTVKEADYVHPSFSSNFINVITVLPAADLRPDKSLTTDLNSKWVKTPIERHLIARGFNVEFSTPQDSRLQDPVDMGALTRDWPAVAKTVDGNWILIVAIRSLERKGIVARKGLAAVTGQFYNKTTGELLWEASGEGSVSAGLALSAILDDGALEAAVNDLMQRFPLR